MSGTMCLHDRSVIEHILRRNTYLHLYEIGDLDDFLWPYTTWYTLNDQIALLYSGIDMPVLLALGEQPDTLADLLRSLLPLLPRKFHAHISGEAGQVLSDSYYLHPHGRHDKMALFDKTASDTIDTSNVIALTESDLPELETLYRWSYPGNSFDPRMLETRCYFGICQDGQLVSVAGIHVYSPHYRVATLGNVTTHPDYRGRGLGTKVCARLCQHLRQHVGHIGLNVKADNASAIACYRRLGFQRIASYYEYDCVVKTEH